MRSLTTFMVLVIGWQTVAAETPPRTSPTADALRTLDPRVLPAEAKADRAVAADIDRRLREAAIRENAAWANVKTRADWEAFRDARIKALRDSLGPWPDAPREVRTLVTGSVKGEGYRIENLVYESRPGLVVTANLYLPADPAPADRKRPGILLSHSHHAAKTQSELQDMGINWARAGCAVLVPDHLGHGERRQHPFATDNDYPGPFKAGRQDYYFRYNTSRQLHLAGESLMGWMAWDLMRGIDVLLARGNADPGKIILIGAVAGGGDPAGVTAALDPRVAAVVPFNFGGPQPDYPIPANAERDFGYFGDPYWESTRCLRNGAAGGFAHWTIVASVAPRRLVYSHEFAWDQPRDPVWPRIQRVFSLFDAAENLATAQGRGTLKGQPPEASHCNNVGPIHRAALYPALKKWFDIDPPVKENQARHKSDELKCLTPAAIAEFKPRPLHDLLAEIAAARATAARDALAKLPPAERRQRSRQEWTKLLGDVEPAKKVTATAGAKESIAGATVERITLRSTDGVPVPFLLLIPPREPATRGPALILFARAGKRELLKSRTTVIADLLASGVTVCVPDLRATGETASDRSRGRNAESTSWSQAELMLGQTMLGQQLRDLRSVLHYLRNRNDIDPARVAVWGDSLAPANPAGTRLDVPIDADPQPRLAEPSAALLAMLATLFDDDIRATNATGGLTSFASCLRSPFLYVPHDAIVPGALTAGDVGDLAAALAPRPVHIDGAVDGLNRGTATEPNEMEGAQWIAQQLK